MACAFAAVIAIFAWIAGSDISLFLLLTGILMLLANILIWVIYLAVRERQPKTAAKKRTARKQTVR
ncbi:MAG TPA: hypothetical protein GXZ64_05550 [Clostridiaceae bacterium]|nr:hypothetical protein [Clostridiaceae bacterium]